MRVCRNPKYDRVVNSVVELGVTGSLRVYRKEVMEGGTINNRAIKASQNVTWKYAVLGVP